MCTCLECGFHSPNDETKCTKNHEHDGACFECKKSFDLFIELLDFHESVESKMKEVPERLGFDSTIEDDMLTWKKDIMTGLENMLIYRAHIAQKEDEGAFDAAFYKDLKEDEAVVIMDYKMKILSSKYRKAQKDWFSKQGFSCLGILLSLGGDTSDDTMNVFYHMYISDDTTQDGEAVNNIKQYVHLNHSTVFGVLFP